MNRYYYIVLAALALAAALYFWSRKRGRIPLVADGDWRPQIVDGTVVPEGFEGTLRFQDDGRVSGHGGCNRFFGDCTITGESISIGPLGSTMMACPQPVMDLEFKFLNALQETTDFRLDNAQLTLIDSSGNTRLVLVRDDSI